VIPRWRAKRPWCPARLGLAVGREGEKAELEPGSQVSRAQSLVLPLCSAAETHTTPRDTSARRDPNPWTGRHPVIAGRLATAGAPDAPATVVTQRGDAVPGWPSGSVRGIIVEPNPNERRV